MTTKCKGIDVTRVDLTSDVAARLIAELNRELSLRYPEDGATHFRLDEDEVAEGRGAFLIARADDEPLGCGAIRRLDTTTAEVKRMYVAPHARGRGVGRALLLALEGEASALGATRVVLETGVRQHEAIALYERAGFVRMPAFGEYVDSPLSVCMEKRLEVSPSGS